MTTEGPPEPARLYADRWNHDFIVVAGDGRNFITTQTRDQALDLLGSAYGRGGAVFNRRSTRWVPIRGEKR